MVGQSTFCCWLNYVWCRANLAANKYKSIRKAPFKTPHKKILRGFVVYF